MSTQFYFPPWNAVVPYKKYDVFYDYYIGANPVFGYATQDSIGQQPSGIYNFAISGYSREDDITTLYFNQTGGNIGLFQAGSLVRIAGITANPSVNYTGMCIDGGIGTLKYINPGWSQTDFTIAAGTVNCPNPCFTTGFYFIPDYSTKITSNNKPIVAKFGDSYESRMPQALNTFDAGYTLAFHSRSNREARALINFTQDTAGVRCFEMVMPVSMFENQPNHKFVSDSVEIDPESYGLNTVTVVVRRVFDL